MNWQEACAASKSGAAVRQDIQKRITRRSDGFAVVSYKPFSSLRRAWPEEIEGFLDWEPEEK